MAGLIGAVALTGRWPVDAPRTHLERHGIVPVEVEQVVRVDLGVGGSRTVLVRGGDGDWLVNGAPVRPIVAGHIATALRLLAVTPPRRVFAAGEYTRSQLAEYGLDPPEFLVTLAVAAKNPARLGFGTTTPAQNAQFVSILSRSEIYLLPRDVGTEWQLARDMALRPANLLLPVSIAQIWAVEIVRGGVLHRFERDPEGLWFHHTGQHVHLPGGFVHKADPKLAPLIAAQFDTLDRLAIAAAVPRHPAAADLAADGLAHPPTILLFYGRDAAGPVARVELGNTAADGRLRYARLQQGDSLVTLPAEVEKPVAALLEIAGSS
jgi:hypothetical protein